MDRQNYSNIVRKVFDDEASAILSAKEKISDELIEELIDIFSYLFQYKGKVIVTGVGKSGIIALKLSSTLSSLGLPSIFLHPNDAMHGDLGKVSLNDVFFCLTKSGNTKELIDFIKKIDVPLRYRIGILGSMNGKINNHLGIKIDASVNSEASKNGLAPTTSTTVSLAVCDAISVLYEEWVNLTPQSFLKWHPAGELGIVLSCSVKKLMIPIEKCASLNSLASLQMLIVSLTDKPNGICFIRNLTDNVIGIIVDGDIKRFLSDKDVTLNSSIERMINKNPVTISIKDSIATALTRMKSNKRSLSMLPVTCENGNIIGVLRMQEIISEGIVYE